MIYFDCCCEIGPRPGKDPVAPWSARDVLRWMDHFRIAAALVVHTRCIHDDPIAARETIAREVRIAPGRLFPVWAVLPAGVWDFDETPDGLILAMRKAGVRAVKLYPRTHNWPLDLSVIGPTLRALEATRTLTLIDFAELPDGKAGQSNYWAFKTLDEILTAFPRLPLLLQNIWWSTQRIVAPLMARHANLYIEFSTFQINRGIEEHARRFGAERLLFGSGLPAMSAGAARAYVDYADLSPNQKALIAGGNLARLLGVPKPTYRGAPLPDRLLARAARGRPLGLPILDAHCHMLSEGRHSAGSYVMYRGDADGIIEMNDRLGISRTAVMSWAGPISCDPFEGNAIVVRAVRKYPGRLMGVAYINPTHLPERRLMAQIRHLVEKEGFVGLKPYGKLGIKYSDPLYAPCWKYADRKHLYALLHLGGAAGGADVVDELAARYPGAQWVIAHTGGSFDMARRVADLMKKHPNVWAELTLTPVTNGVIEWLVSEVGDDRILFGTDAPMRDPRQQLGWVVWADLPVSSRKKILGANFRRLLSMQGRYNGSANG